MGRKHTFHDKEFRRVDYDPDDAGDFTPDLVFVIMPFAGDDVAAAYLAIREAAGRRGLAAVRVDEAVGSGIVLAEITNYIEQAEFIVCDLSHERPNVYYELGYAHGVGNEGPDILLVAREGTRLHFDIAPLRVHYYRSEDHLRSIVEAKLGAMIEMTRNR
jgi:hypothetical protein